MRCKGCNNPIGSDGDAGLYWQYEGRAKGKRSYLYHGFGLYHHDCAPQGGNVKWLAWDYVRKTPFRDLVRELKQYATFNEDELLDAIRE